MTPRLGPTMKGLGLGPPWRRGGKWGANLPRLSTPFTPRHQVLGSHRPSRSELTKPRFPRGRCQERLGHGEIRCQRGE